MARLILQSLFHSTTFDTDRSGWIRRSHFEDTLKRRSETTKDLTPEVKKAMLQLVDRGNLSGQTKGEIQLMLDNQRNNPVPNFDVPLIERFFGARGAVDKHPRRKL